ncbi:hypothetical protein AURDEDRAFT_175903 [Auricularia subglabra TFB-10046 SS5]|uniref:Glycoside hydrolase family 31 TIM barrel domain-containing protein n=1 Tax=Auricularia subglabra (strain TFB-10046 / SS5) TaxID=717982 RepID=J0D7F4_AURST|nr:hypothetical protein AURDEDRAFT_175903 [Auricularia subglabra TFB-10046 SS5]
MTRTSSSKASGSTCTSGICRVKYDPKTTKRAEIKSTEMVKRADTDGKMTGRRKSGVIDFPPCAIHNALQYDIHNTYGYGEEKATFNALLEINPTERPFLISRPTLASLCFDRCATTLLSVDSPGPCASLEPMNSTGIIRPFALESVPIPLCSSRRPPSPPPLRAALALLVYFTLHYLVGAALALPPFPLNLATWRQLSQCAARLDVSALRRPSSTCFGEASPALDAPLSRAQLRTSVASPRRLHVLPALRPLTPAVAASLARPPLPDPASAGCSFIASIRRVARAPDPDAAADAPLDRALLSPRSAQLRALTKCRGRPSDTLEACVTIAPSGKEYFACAAGSTVSSELNLELDTNGNRKLLSVWRMVVGEANSTAPLEVSQPRQPLTKPCASDRPVSVQLGLRPTFAVQDSLDTLAIGWPPLASTLRTTRIRCQCIGFGGGNVNVSIESPV